MMEYNFCGIRSGDCECGCIDVSADDFVKLTGEYPCESDKSLFYVGLYRYYGLVIPRVLIEKTPEHVFLDIHYELSHIHESAKITMSIKATHEKGKYIYDGYEHDEWFK